MTIRLAEGAQFLTSGPYETGRRGRDYRDVLVACPEVRNCAVLATRQVRNQLVHGLFGIKWDSSGLWAGFVRYMVLLTSASNAFSNVPLPVTGQPLQVIWPVLLQFPFHPCDQPVHVPLQLWLPRQPPGQGLHRA